MSGNPLLATGLRDAVDVLSTACGVLATRAPAPGGGMSGQEIHCEDRLTLTRYTRADAPITRTSVLLIPPLAVPATAIDLRAGHSLLEDRADRGQTAVRDLRFETAPGGHGGALTATAAKATTCAYLPDHLARSEGKQQ